jgi:hypothetical protein
MYVLYKIKKHIFTSKLFGCIKTFKTKKVLKFSNFFSEQCTGCVVRWVSGNFSRIGEYSSTVKNRPKWASVHRRVGLKGIFLYIVHARVSRTRRPVLQRRVASRPILSVDIGFDHGGGAIHLFYRTSNYHAACLTLLTRPAHWTTIITTFKFIFIVEPSIKNNGSRYVDT